MKNNKKFEILPHTADVRLKVFGKTKEELFKNAMLGMAQILKNQPRRPKGSGLRSRRFRSALRQNRRQPPASEKLFKTKIKIKSPDINSLLVDFLSEVLYQSQINHAVFPEVKFLKFNYTELEAEIFGSEVDIFDEDIKAVTYHELEIKKSPPAGGSGGFETIIVFDI